MPEHMGRGGITMQQQEHGTVGGTGFPVENLDSVSLDNFELGNGDIWWVRSGGLILGRGCVSGEGGWTSQSLSKRPSPSIAETLFWKGQ
jgi:hypothetical protein